MKSDKIKNKERRKQELNSFDITSQIQYTFRQLCSLHLLPHAIIFVLGNAFRCFTPQSSPILYEFFPSSVFDLNMFYLLSSEWIDYLLNNVDSNYSFIQFMKLLNKLYV